MKHSAGRLLFPAILALAAVDPAAAQTVDDLGHAQTVRALEGIVWAVMTPLGFITAICGLVYLGHAMIQHRRWIHAVRIQTEVHTKIVDRLASNEELLAYLQSPGGQKLLTVAPGVVETDRGTPAPAARILWSVQTGIVLALAGIGLWIGAGGAIREVTQALRIVATFVVAVGVGFTLSAAASLVLSRRLGLIDGVQSAP